MSFQWIYSRYKTPSSLTESIQVREINWNIRECPSNGFISKLKWGFMLCRIFFIFEKYCGVFHKRISFEVYFVRYKLILLLSPFIYIPRGIFVLVKLWTTKKMCNNALLIYLKWISVLESMKCGNNLHKGHW